MELELTSDCPELLAHLQDLRESVQPGATAEALNRTATQARRMIVDQTAKRTGLTKTTINRRVKVRGRASPKKPNTLLFGGLWEINVKDLKPAPRQLKTKVKYKTIKGETPRTDGFFIPGKRSVFYREGADRFPIHRVVANLRPYLRFSVIKTMRSRELRDFYESEWLDKMDNKVKKSLARRGLIAR